MGIVGAGYGTVTQGAKTQALLAAGRREPQYIGYADISNDLAPLNALMKKFGKNRKVGSNAYFHLEDDQQPLFVTVSDAGGLSDSDTTMGVAAGHGARVVANMILYVERTEEMIRVTARATDSLTIVRGFGGTTAAAINDAEEIRIQSMADTDGNTAPAAISGEPTSITNYSQIFKTAWDVTGRAQETEVYGPNEWSRLEQQHAGTVMRFKEQAYLTSNGRASTEPTATGGLPYWVTTNVTNAGGALDENSWNSWLRTWLRRNVGQKSLCVLAGELVTAALAGFARDAIRYAADDSVIGINCGKYRAENGMIVTIHPHGMLTAAYSSVTGANKGWPGWAFGINYSKLGECTFRKLKRQQNIQTPGTDGRKDGLIEDAGLQLVSEQHHAIYKGVTG